MSDEDLEIEVLMRALARADRRAAVWCGCLCARTVLHLVPTNEARPQRVIEGAEAWVRGEVPEAWCREGNNDESALYCIWGSVRNASDNACCTALAVWGDDGLSDDPSYVAVMAAHSVLMHFHEDLVGYTAWARTIYTDALDDRDVGAFDESHWRVARASRRHFAHLLSRVSAVRWPLTTPTPTQLHAAPYAVQVAWDASTDPSIDHTVAELVEARARAARLGLDWNDPVQRAIAERADDEERVGRLLGGEGEGEGRAGGG